MNNYEVLYILPANLSEEAAAAQIDKYSALVTSSGGEVEKVDKWGVKKFAYPIDFKTEGNYVLMTFKASSSLPLEMERQMKLSDEIIRYMLVNKD